MGHVEFDREPPTNLTTMVMAFGGWIDAGHAATGALRHLVRDLAPTRLAWIDPPDDRESSQPSVLALLP